MSAGDLTIEPKFKKNTPQRLMLYIKLVRSQDIIKCEQEKEMHFHFQLGGAEVTSRVGKGYDEVEYNQELYIDDKTATELWITVKDDEFSQNVVVFSTIKLSTFEDSINAWFDLYNLKSEKQGQMLLYLCKNGRPATKLPKVSVGISYQNKMLRDKIVANFGNTDKEANEWKTTKKSNDLGLGKLGSWSPSF